MAAGSVAVTSGTITITVDGVSVCSYTAGASSGWHPGQSPAAASGPSRPIWDYPNYAVDMTTSAGTPLAKVSSLSNDGTQFSVTWLNGSRAAAEAPPAGPRGPLAGLARAHPAPGPVSR